MEIDYSGGKAGSVARKILNELKILSDIKQIVQLLMTDAEVVFQVEGLKNKNEKPKAFELKKQ